MRRWRGWIPSCRRTPDRSGRSGGRVPSRPQGCLQHGLQSRNDRAAREGKNGGRVPACTRRAKLDPRVRRLERDRPASPAGWIRFHRFCRSRPIRRLGRRRCARAGSDRWDPNKSCTRFAKPVDFGQLVVEFDTNRSTRDPLSRDNSWTDLTVVTGGAGFIGSHLVRAVGRFRPAGARDREAGSGRRSSARRGGGRFRGHSRSRCARWGV